MIGKPNSLEISKRFLICSTNIFKINKVKGWGCGQREVRESSNYLVLQIDKLDGNPPTYSFFNLRSDKERLNFHSFIDMLQGITRISGYYFSPSDIAIFVRKKPG